MNYRLTYVGDSTKHDLPEGVSPFEDYDGSPFWVAVGSGVTRREAAQVALEHHLMAVDRTKWSAEIAGELARAVDTEPRYYAAHEACSYEDLSTHAEGCGRRCWAEIIWAY